MYKKKAVLTTGTSTSTSSSSSVSPTPTGPIDNPGNANYSLVGCYAEPPTGRALSILTGADDMTVDKCLGICSAYIWAGAEYGRHVLHPLGATSVLIFPLIENVGAEIHLRAVRSPRLPRNAA